MDYARSYNKLAAIFQWCNAVEISFLIIGPDTILVIKDLPLMWESRDTFLFLMDLFNSIYILTVKSIKEQKVMVGSGNL